jgi:hypothetical protein
MKNTISNARDGRTLTAAASHERAVARMQRGAVTMYAGVGTLVVVLVGNVFGGAGVAHNVAVIGAGALAFAGLTMGASAAPHFMRFGRRFSVAALTCFGIAGIAGLIGVAELFESAFLDSTRLQTLGKWAVRAAGGFAVVGSVLLSLAQRRTQEHVKLADPWDDRA